MYHATPHVTYRKNIPIGLFSKNYRASLVIFTLAFTALSFNTSVNAYSVESEKSPRASRSIHSEQQPIESWAFSLDNDIFSLSERDQDYTGGIAITYNGSKAKDFPLAPHSTLSQINHTLDTDTKGDIEGHSLEIGAFGFTPEEITATDPLAGDRPYASLVYVSALSERIDSTSNTAWISSLTVGVLGLDIVGDAQNSLHEKFDGDTAQGWKNQISEGGEPTARYSIAKQKLALNFKHFELKASSAVSLGYLTEVSHSLSFRAGHISSPWWNLKAELSNYGEQPNAGMDKPTRSEHYLWGGAMVKYRVYNAFLQGQFRDSELSYRSRDLNQALIEAWLGYTFALPNDYKFSYVLRGHTSELKSGQGNRDLLWGGLILSKTFR